MFLKKLSWIIRLSQTHSNQGFGLGVNKGQNHAGEFSTAVEWEIEQLECGVGRSFTGGLSKNFGRSVGGDGKWAGHCVCGERYYVVIL